MDSEYRLRIGLQHIWIEARHREGKDKNPFRWGDKHGRSSRGTSELVMCRKPVFCEVYSASFFVSVLSDEVCSWEQPCCEVFVKYAQTSGEDTCYRVG